MRTIFTEHDLISAEIQNINTDGVIALHTRSLKYGKLSNGQIVQVPSVLIPRLPQHFISLEISIDVLLGVNGMIWITRTMPREWLLDQEASDLSTPQVETLFRLQALHTETPLTVEERLKICRVRNSIEILALAHLLITPESILCVYSMAEKAGLSPAVSICDG